MGGQEMLFIHTNAEHVGVSKNQNAGRLGAIRPRLFTPEAQTVDSHHATIGTAQKALRLGRRSVEPSFGFVIDPQTKISRDSGPPDRRHVHSEKLRGELDEQEQADEDNQVARKPSYRPGSERNTQTRFSM